VALPQILGADGDVFVLPRANHVRACAMGTVRLMVLIHLGVRGSSRASLQNVEYVIFACCGDSKYIYGAVKLAFAA